MSGTRQKTLGEQLSQTLAAEGRGEALSPRAVGPDVFRAQLRLSTGALRPSGSGSGAALHRRRLRRRGRYRSRKVFGVRFILPSGLLNAVEESGLALYHFDP